MEDLVSQASPRFPDKAFWAGRSVLVTGHTGFKGAWLSTWLYQLGAKVTGLSLEPPTTPNLYEEIGLAHLIANDIRVDIRDYDALASAFAEYKPSVVFHLAAQSLVRDSYLDPLGTFSTNVLGTAHALEAARHCGAVEAIVVVTTDKCYENQESLHRYREGDRLGGYDPYSTSKACAELVASCWRSSYGAGGMPRIASARAGNVIGAGDWSANRLLPDCFHAFANNASVHLRHPQAVRPWQHVLEPLNGYLLLAESLGSTNGSEFSQAWNFGPGSDSEACVGDVASMAAKAWGPTAKIELAIASQTLHEAGQLRLDSTLAHTKLNWTPQWSLAKAVEATAMGYRAHKDRANFQDLVLRHIGEYVSGDE